MQEIRFKSGDEQDALTRWRRWLNWRAGQRKRIKRLFRRRVRTITNQELRETLRFLSLDEIEGDIR